MCGIAGLFELRNSARNRDPAATAQAMADTLAHRGPDGRDAWGDAEAGIGLGHRRLAIIDLSSTGAQPMHSSDGRFVITYNGEVYNFQDLRAELAARGHLFRGTSDTEVMLAAFMEWGIEQATRRFVGMFAFAVFDRKTRSLHLVRDRLGVKPLYWAIADGAFLFGSELRALMAHSSFHREVNREAIAAMLRYSYIPAPATAFQDVFKLTPGSILTIRPNEKPEIKRYWRIEDVVAQRGRSKLSSREAIDDLDRHLRDAVRCRMVADVPIGAFLSGGTDSAIVVALMQAQSSRPVRSFTIGFRDAAYNEAKYARAVADHLGTDHTEIELDEDAALNLVPQVAQWFDEPFADSSQLPTYLVSRMTRQHVAVALSGDGGDELFAGYPKYAWFDRVWRSVGYLPSPLRRMIGRATAAMPERALQALAEPFLDSGRAERIGEKVRRLGLAITACDADSAAMALSEVGCNESNLVLGAIGTLHLSPLREVERSLPDLISRMQANDFTSYLPDDILTKVDRCSMAVSLEARAPLLDHRLIEFVWSLPRDIHHGNKPKGLLRDLLARYIPPAMVDRPKRGFSIPLGEWLRGPLRDWADTLLAPDKLSRDGLLNGPRIDRLWRRHLAGTEKNATGLWNILMVRAWSERWLSK